MFNESKYTRWYLKIITHASQRKPLDGYVEKHHIIPKCIGGSDSSSNIVLLTAKEHFICHKLLTKMAMTPDSKLKMQFAFFSMTRSNQNQKRTRLSSREYSRVRNMFSEHMKIWWDDQQRKDIASKRMAERWKDEEFAKMMKSSIANFWDDENRSRKSEKMREYFSKSENRKKQSDALIAANQDPEVRRKKSKPGEENPMYGRHHTKETILKIKRSKESNYEFKTYEEKMGKERAIELKAKRSEQMKHRMAATTNTGRNNANAKTYAFVDPFGEVHIITGQLRSFCKEHRLDIGAMIDLHKKRRIEYKGWTVRY